MAKQERRHCLLGCGAVRVGCSTPTATSPTRPAPALVDGGQRTGVGSLTQSGRDDGVGGSGCSGGRDGHGRCSGAVRLRTTCSRCSRRGRGHDQRQLQQRRPWRWPKRRRAGDPPRPVPPMPTTRAADHPPWSAIKRRGVQPAAKKGCGAGGRQGSQRACLSPPSDSPIPIPARATCCHHSQRRPLGRVVAPAVRRRHHQRPSQSHLAADALRRCHQRVQNQHEFAPEHHQYHQQARSPRQAGSGHRRRDKCWRRPPPPEPEMAPAASRGAVGQPPTLPPPHAIADPNRRHVPKPHHHPGRSQAAIGAAPSTRPRPLASRQASGACCLLHHHAQSGHLADTSPPPQTAGAATPSNRGTPGSASEGVGPAKTE